MGPAVLAAVVVLVSVVSGVTETHSDFIRSRERPNSGEFRPVVGEVAMPVNVAVFYTAKNIDGADARLDFCNFGRREEAGKNHKFVIGAVPWDRGHGKIEQALRCNQSVLLRQTLNLDIAPVTDAVGRGLSGVFNDDKGSNLSRVDGRRVLIQPISDSDAIGEDVRAELPMSGPLRNPDLDNTDCEQEHREVGNGITQEPEEKTDYMRTGVELAGSLAIIGIVLAAIGVGASKRYPRLTIYIVGLGAVIFGLSIFGFSDALCTYGSCP